MAVVNFVASSWLPQGVRTAARMHRFRRRQLLFVFRLLGLELGFDRDNSDPEMPSSILVGGDTRPSRPDDQRDRDQDVLNLLERDTSVGRRADVRGIRSSRDIDGDPAMRARSRRFVVQSARLDPDPR